MNEITNHKEYAAERKLFQYTPFINQKREEIMKQQRVEQKKHDFKYAFFSSGIDVAGYIATIVIVLFMFPQLKIHAISMGFFLAFTRASLSLNSTIFRLSYRSIFFKKTIGYFSSTKSILERILGTFGNKRNICFDKEKKKREFL